MNKWKISCGGMAVLAAGLAIFGAWWVYRWVQPAQIEIVNNSSHAVFVNGEPVDLCPPRVRVGAMESGVYKGDWLLCRTFAVRFETLTSGAIKCAWTNDLDDHPIVVTDKTLSCSPDP